MMKMHNFVLLLLLLILLLLDAGTRGAAIIYAEFIRRPEYFVICQKQCFTKFMNFFQTQQLTELRDFIR